MKAVTSVDVVSAHVVAPPNPPIRVSFHVVREARNDVRLMRAATALVAAGYDVSIVDIAVDRRQSAEEHLHDIHFRHVIIPDWQTSRHFEPLFFVKAVQALFRSTLHLLREKADVYHASDLNALPASCLAALLRHKPLVVDVYDLQFPAPETSIGFWRRLSRLLTYFHALVLPRCAGVIATSPLHVQEIRNRFHIPEVLLLRNILSYQPVEKSDRLRRLLCLGPNVRIALYQGGLQPDRQLDRLIHAAPFLERDIVIVMIGSSIGETQAQLEALIASEGVADRVKIIPPVPYEELLDWTSSADIGLIIYSPDYSLNVQMCLPNKLFEFLMAGLPVLASRLEAVTDIIRTYNVGQVVPSLTPEDIGAAINSMLADQEALAHMHRNALEAAKRELNWEKESQQLVDLYSSVLAKKNK